ncbi:MAG: GH116 family glycosyl hydrolase [Calditrichia bacterium]
MKLFLVHILMILFFALQIFAQDGTIPSFQLEKNTLQLTRSAQVGTPFDKVGRKFAIIGEESGSFEAWAYPLKLFRSFNFSFFIGSSTRPIQAKEIVRYIDVTPEATTITYTYQSFTIRATYITPVDEAGAMILLDVNATEPLAIVCGFLPILQPMWPAGIGGQYASWNKELKAYLISEPTRKNHGLIGSPAASGISSTPAHMLSDAPNEFKIEIKDPDSVRGRFIPIYMAGGKGERDQIINIYKRMQADPEKYYRQNIAYYQQLRDNTLRIETPVPQLDLAYEWAKVALDNMMVDNPDLGEGLVAGLGASGTSGRPGFGWYFGGDAFMNMLSFNSYGAFQTVKDALRFTQKWQRKDGKMAHELSQAAGYVDWWNDYPYGYIHGDTTPFYIVAMSDYYARSGDVQFIKDSWNSLRRAYQWCLKTDANGDGLMDNKQAGLGASEYGELSGIETDVYLAAVWIRATQGMQVLARAIGDDKMAGQAEKDSREAEKAYNRHFWVEDGGYYAYAFNADGQKVKEISPWQCVGLMWNLGTPERSRLSLQKVNSAELTTDWGVRLLSDKSKFYQPLGYNYGAVWPFVTGWVNMAQFQHHFSIQGYNTLMSSARHTFDNELGSVSEVFSGTLNIWMGESVPHQGFSSTGIVYPLVRGLLSGMSRSIMKRQCSIRYLLLKVSSPS